MKLYYRGFSYEHNTSQVTSRKTGQPFQPVRESRDAHNLRYRGNIYHVEPNTKKIEVSGARATYLLIYRGISYLFSKTLPGNVTEASQLVNTASKARSTWDG